MARHTISRDSKGNRNFWREGGGGTPKARNKYHKRETGLSSGRATRTGRTYNPDKGKYNSPGK